MNHARRRRMQIDSLFVMVLLFLLNFMTPTVDAGTQPRLTVYFPNWNIYQSADAQVKNLPWEKVDCICHAFWKILPNGDGYSIVSTDPWADTAPDNPNAHFAQYARCAAQHPQTDILLSIACGVRHSIADISLTARTISP